MEDLNYQVAFRQDNFFELLDYVGSMRQGLAISAGMGPVEKAAINLLADSGDYGDLLPTSNNSKQHLLRIKDKTRVNQTYAVDAIFVDNKTNTHTLVDIKPSTHDNDTSPASHASKFISAFEFYKLDNPSVNVRFVIAVYGGKTQEQIDNDKFSKAWTDNGIEILSLTTQYGFDESETKKQLMLESFEARSLSALKRGNGNNELHKQMMNLVNSMKGH